MGEVWRSYDTAIYRFVALKVLPTDLANDEVFQERFRREARAAAGLDEPHVVPIHDFGEVDGRLFVTMRLINGRDLQQLLGAGPLAVARAVAIIEQIASALHAAHQVGLVHRDVKPSNILVTEDDFAYLIDFGIARSVGETGLTLTGATVGTWSYMAPERFRDGGIEPSSDIYALACVLYQAMTAQLPYPGTTLEQVAMAHMTAPPPKPSAQRRGIPAAMDQVIAKGLAKQPNQRYLTAKDLAKAARAALRKPDTDSISRARARARARPRPHAAKTAAKTTADRPARTVAAKPDRSAKAGRSVQRVQPVQRPAVSVSQVVLFQAFLVILTVLIVVVLVALQA